MPTVTTPFTTATTSMLQINHTRYLVYIMRPWQHNTVAFHKLSSVKRHNLLPSITTVPTKLLGTKHTPCACVPLKVTIDCVAAGDVVAAVAGLLVNSAYLAQANGVSAVGLSTAQQLAQAVTTSKLSSQDQANAFAQAIQQSVHPTAYSADYSALPGTIAILVAAAESAHQNISVLQGFSQVCSYTRSMP